MPPLPVMEPWFSAHLHLHLFHPFPPMSPTTYASKLTSSPVLYLAVLAASEGYKKNLFPLQSWGDCSPKCSVAVPLGPHPIQNLMLTTQADGHRAGKRDQDEASSRT